MSESLILSTLKKGVGAVVESIEGNELRSKLLELGLTTGCKVKILYTAPLGNPIAVNVEGFVLSLRKSEASLIHVHQISTN